MSFWEDLMKGGAEGLIGGVGSLALKIRETITGEGTISSEERIKILEMTNALEAAAQNLDLEVLKGQNAINLEEAKSTNLFKSGWRPAVGWACVMGLVYSFLIKPLLPWTIQVVGIPFGYTSVLPVMPDIPMSDLLVLLAGMLGFGGYRMMEKKWGVA